MASCWKVPATFSLGLVVRRDGRASCACRFPAAQSEPLDDPGKNRKETLHRLLAGGGLSGEHREQILERILPSPEVRRRRPWVSLLTLTLVPAVAAATILLVRVGGDKSPSSHVTAKGTAASPILEAHCPDRPPAQCQRGDRLIFEVNGVTPGALFGAYAERPSGERIWYFPTLDGRLPEVPSGHGVIGEGIRLGDEHIPGPYSLHLFVLDSVVKGGSDLRAALVSGRLAARGTAVIPVEVLP